MAAHVLKRNAKNYIQRFGDPDGLKCLGMFDSGIIWNGHETKWRTLREYFQKGTKNRE